MEIKNQRTVRKERLKEELRWVRSVDRFTTADIADRFNVSRCTAWNDIVALMADHPEIESVGETTNRYYEWCEPNAEGRKPGTVYTMTSFEGTTYLFLEIDRTPWAVYGFRAYPITQAPISHREVSRFPEFTGTNGRRYFVDAARLRTQSSKHVEASETLTGVRDISNIVEAMYGRYAFT